MKVELTKEWCMNMAKGEAAAGDPDCSAGAPTRDLVERLRDTSGGHINGLYDKRAADELERLAEQLEALHSEMLAALADTHELKRALLTLLCESDESDYMTGKEREQQARDVLASVGE